jgi:hypothetical protein
MTPSPLAVQDFFTKEVLDYLADELDKRRAARELPERWVTQAKYAKQYGVGRKYIWSRIKFLEMKKAVQGKGRDRRYDITVSPINGRRSRI